MSDSPPEHSPLDEIIPAEQLEHAEAGALPTVDFKPWHLPRKHHVRKSQWGRAFERLLPEIPDRLLIKYLCLPGEDLLDVQILADICKREGRTLRYLGFDTSEHKSRRTLQRVSAEQILRQTGVVDAQSEVLPDYFSSVARQNSKGNRSLRDGGSYDVVNLDLCDAFTSDPTQPMHSAILELLTHQCNRRGEPWLLFITTRSETARINQDELRSYADCIQHNAASSVEFLSQLLAIGGLAATMHADDACAALMSQLPEDTGLCGRYLALGVGKWLLNVLLQHDPWRVDLLSLQCYRTGLASAEAFRHASGAPNLFSMAFKFEKIRAERVDRVGIVPSSEDGLDGTSPRFSIPTELSLAEKMAKCVRQHTVDIDSELQAQSAVRSQLLEECASLLKVRYYSENAYREWVDGIPSIPN